MLTAEGLQLLAGVAAGVAVEAAVAAQIVAAAAGTRAAERDYFRRLVPLAVAGIEAAQAVAVAGAAVVSSLLVERPLP